MSLFEELIPTPWLRVVLTIIFMVGMALFAIVGGILPIFVACLIFHTLVKKSNER